MTVCQILYEHPADQSVPRRIGRSPALQYSGPDAEELKLSGVICPHFKGGLRQVELMRLRAKAAQPMMMVDGLGWVWDRWVIDQVEERKGVFLRDGAPRKNEFTLSLKSYGKDNGVLSSPSGRLNDFGGAYGEIAMGSVPNLPSQPLSKRAAIG